jgi:hypothetical protein
MKEKNSLQTTSNDSLHYVNSSLNISWSIWITLFILEPPRVLTPVGGALTDYSLEAVTYPL